MRNNDSKKWIMNYVKRIIKKPPISWVIMEVDENGELSTMTCDGVTKHPIRDDLREFELYMTDNKKIVMRWETGMPCAYQIEVDGSGVRRSLFDDAERLVIVTLADELKRKEEFCWYKRKANNEGGVDYVQKPIPPEKLDNTYELYRIVYWFVRLCNTIGIDGNRMANRVTFYIAFPGNNDAKEVLRLLFSAYLELCHIIPESAQWDVVVYDKVFVKQTRNPMTIIAKDEDRDWIHTIEDDYSKNEILIRRAEISRGD